MPTNSHSLVFLTRNPDQFPKDPTTSYSSCILLKSQSTECIVVLNIYLSK